MTRLHPVVRPVGLSLLVSLLLVLMLPGAAQAVPPTNDAFADAVEVTEPLPFTDTQDTTEATLEDGEPLLDDFNCGFGVSNTVWYAYSPTVDTTVSANTFGSDFDTVLGVWEGTSLDSLTLVGCVDDAFGLQSRIVFLAETGTDYRIQVGGFDGDSGTLEFKVRETTGGVIEGTMTDEATTDPIAGACVLVTDAAFGEQNSAFFFTGDDGAYRVAVRPGEYFVQFFDCQEDAYVVEWWDDVAEVTDATEIVVTDGSVTTGVDAALTPACPGWGSSGRNQIVGTPDGDELVGTSEPDVICGFGGDDTLSGKEGRDNLFGGRGDDILRGGLGADFLSGDRGRDRCIGGDGNDRLRSCEIEVD